jgi:hypothetical protein
VLEDQGSFMQTLLVTALFIMKLLVEQNIPNHLEHPTEINLNTLAARRPEVLQQLPFKIAQQCDTLPLW